MLACRHRHTTPTADAGDKIKSQFSGRVFEVADCGLLHPDAVSTSEGLAAGQCGWLTCAMKDAREAVLGDTFYDPASSPAETPAEAFESQRCMVFAGLYPVDAAAFTKLDDAIRRVGPELRRRESC